MINLGTISLPSAKAPIGNFERTNSFSIEVWFYQTSMKNGSLVSHGTPSPQLRGWMAQSWTGRNLGLSLCSDNVAVNYLNVRTAASIFTFNTWNHAVFTYNGSSLASGIKIYVNGALKAGTVVANALTDTIQNTEPLRVGNSYTYGGFPGRIDEVVVYDRVLAQSEVTSRYNGGLGTETLVGPAYLQYHLNEASGSTVSDSSGNNRNANTVGDPTWISGKLNNAIQLNGSTQHIAT